MRVFFPFSSSSSSFPSSSLHFFPLLLLPSLPGADRVHCHSRASSLECCRLRETRHAVLGGVVRGFEGRGDQGVHGTGEREEREVEIFEIF